jgi:ppGpp synthetase/RelA/SpoT-type nucleotidyltranferase
MSRLEDLAQEYAAEQPRHERLAQVVAAKCKEAVARQGILCDVSHRAKEVDSFVKKALRLDRAGKPKYGDPLRQITDKAGVRVIVPLNVDVDPAVDAICRAFDHRPIEDKRKELEFDRLGYLGVHVDTSLREGEAVGQHTEFRGLTCEVQVHTRSGHLWSEANHDLLYKAALNVPVELQRRIYRLLALVELFDSELVGTKRLIEDTPGYEDAVLLTELEKRFYKLTAVRFDREFSLANLRLLRSSYDDAQNGPIIDLVDALMRDQWRRLEDLYREQLKVGGRSPFIFQPEGLMIFERLASTPLKLQVVWKDAYSLEDLRPIGALWGVPIDTT